VNDGTIQPAVLVLADGSAFTIPRCGVRYEEPEPQWPDEFADTRYYVSPPLQPATLTLTAYPTDHTGPALRGPPGLSPLPLPARHAPAPSLTKGPL